MKAILYQWSKTRDGVTVGLYDDGHWRKGRGYAREYLSRRPTVTVGAYTQGLFAYGKQKCRWFTVFRQ